MWINTSEAATSAYILKRTGSEGKNIQVFIWFLLDHLANVSFKIILEGKYVSDIDKWAYKPDNRGKYVHMHVPYNGGYGPFQVRKRINSLQFIIKAIISESL